MKTALMMIRAAGCLLVMALVFVVVAPFALLCAALGLLDVPDHHRP